MKQLNDFNCAVCVHKEVCAGYMIIKTSCNYFTDASGISPGRLRELVQAEKEGRCAVLPCKAGIEHVEETSTADAAPVNREPCDCCRLGIKTVSFAYPTTHEYGGTWRAETERTPKYCPMCGRKLEEPK